MTDQDDQLEVGTALAASSDRTTDVRAHQWRQLEAALHGIRMAEFGYMRGDVETGAVHLDDARRAIGTLALTLAEGPAAEGYSRLFETILTPPFCEEAVTRD